MRLFGTSGIRKIADRSLLEIAFKTGLALGQRQKDVVIARDTRTSGNALKFSLLSGLLSAGVKCRDAGIVPTPTLAAAIGESEIGIMITASHNPPQYNGIKIFNPDGSSFNLRQQADLEKVIDSCPVTSPWAEMQTECIPYPRAINNHINRIKEHISTLPRIKVIVDCGCGAGSVITPYLLRQLGCEVISLNGHPSGFFPHDIEPIESNLEDLMTVCRQLQAVGIAHDGDADRMMAVDEKGRFISGDKLMVILARRLNAKEIVTTVDASMIVEELGFQTRRTKVGDTFVSEALRNGGDFGGEPSGAWVFPSGSLCPDGIYAAAVLASIASKEKLASLIDSIPQYPILRGSVPGSDAGFQRLTEPFSKIAVGMDTVDGYKMTFEDGWVLCRPSGTEPKIRITAEAKDEARVHQLYDLVVETIQEVLNTEEQRS